MRIGKYKYYFRKPRSEIAKDILKHLMVVGAVCVAASSPNFSIKLLRNISVWKKYPRKKFSSVFYVLKKQNCLNIERKGCQIYINLTKEGKKRAGWLQIDDLKIEKINRWDRKWRIVMFDISQLKRFYREAFRGKIKQLGFVPFQKSVWIMPFNCTDEIELLKDFFGLTDQEVRLVIAEDIGETAYFKKVFNVS